MWMKRQYAMAGDVGGIDVTQSGPLTVVIGVVSAALGAFGLWLANRMLGKAAFQTAINSGFQALTDQLQEERKEMQARWDLERINWAATEAQLRGEIINLTQAIESLKAYLRRKGLDVPEAHAPAADFIMLEGRKE